MTIWHEEFRAYARAFGEDEVAAILLRDGEREWLVWPAQTVEGLTFTLTADAILESVPGDDLQHVVGWVHSHPSGIAPSPSGTDDDQIRALAKDLAGGVAEMVIFGGHDYSLHSVTHAVLVGDRVFVSDTETWRQASAASKWDEQAKALYAASRPARPAIGKWRPAGSGAWHGSSVWDEGRAATANEMAALGSFTCPWCAAAEVNIEGELCGDCDDWTELAGQDDVRSVM